MKLPLGISLVVFASLLGSCRCGNNEPTPSSASSSTPSSSAQITSMTSSSASKAMPGVPWANVPSATAMSLPNMPIPERFEIEKNTRPTDAQPKVEDVWAALERAGLVIVEKKQHLAAPFGARYCEGARAVQDKTTLVQLSVCEFINADLAKTASEHSEEAMKRLIPNRHVVPNKRSALIMRPEADKPECVAAGEKAITTFKAL